MSKKLTDEELGKLIEDFAREEEWGAVDTLPDAEREAKLEKSGIDRKKAREIGERAYDAMEAGAKGGGAAKEGSAPPKVVRLEDRRRERFWRMQRIATYAVAACVLIGIGVWLGRGSTGPTEVGQGFDGGPHFAEVHELTRSALMDCSSNRFAECLRKLDQAAALRPENEYDRDVKRARAHAMEELAREGGEE